jgi:homoserine O-succinyltransferase
MPVHLAGDTSPHASAARCIHIGLINNTPNGALEATERQFRALLDSVSHGVNVRLSPYALPDVPRTESGRLHISRFYSGIDNLWDSRLDGLIVTGAEPLAPSLRDEPYWGSLTKVLDWADHNTHSTVLSCLAAHAAVEYIDRIGRRRLGDKRFGVFECARTSDHPLMTGVPSLLQMPHSRWNDLPKDELVDCGYSVLTRAKDGSVDAFVRQRKSLFVFFQGHPEYESNTLLLEYRRDIGRYLTRERDTYPSMPKGYFDRDTADALATFRRRALSGRNVDLLGDFPTALAEKGIANTWYTVAARVYGNWLTYLCVEKERRLNEKGRYRKRLMNPSGV